MTLCVCLCECEGKEVPLGGWVEDEGLYFMDCGLLYKLDRQNRFYIFETYTGGLIFVCLLFDLYT